ncbi:hypothetical protein ABIF70_005217 [Bradyrhizobium japonicum]
MPEVAIYQWEFNQKLASLENEVGAWMDETKTTRNLMRHNSQVQAFTDMLAVIRRAIEPTAKNPVLDAADARERSKVLLGLFRIWEFLRSKLAQRRERRFEDFLRIADEYAWLCYQPVYDYGLKEPPLVFLNGGYSPFTLVRRSQFQAESVPQELMRGRPLLDATKSLPFPVIGVPWYQYNTLADLTVIGHEVGHSIEADLGLTTAIEDAIANVVDDQVRRQRWTIWGSEAFADLYGVMAGGAAFVSALAHFLAHEDSNVETEGYPPASIRVRFNIAVLEALGGNEDACPTLTARWQKVFPLAAEHLDYCKDLTSLANSLLDRISNGERKLRDWLCFNNYYMKAGELAKAALGKSAIKENESFFALALAFRLGYDKVIDSGQSAQFAEFLPRLDRLRIAMLEGMQPGLRTTEAGLTREATAVANAREYRAKLWLDALRG